MENSNLNNTTHQNFLNFCKNTKFRTIFGFHNNGVVALTNNENLFNLLHVIQFQKMQNKPIQTFTLKSLKDLKHLAKSNNNSIHFRQENLDDNLLILADDEQKLKDYTPFIVEYFKNAPNLEFFATIGSQANIKFDFENKKGASKFSFRPGFDHILLCSFGSLKNIKIIDDTIDKLIYLARFSSTQKI